MRHGVLLSLACTLAAASQELPQAAGTTVTVADGHWAVNGHPTNPGTPAEGLLLNVRMVNAVFEDRGRPDFDPEANTDRFIARVGDYAAQGVNAFTICLQGGMPGYEGAVNSAFEPDGSLRPAYLARVERVIRACDRHGLAVILGLYYQRQSAVLRDEAAVRAGVVNAARWVRERGFANVLLEIANEYPHQGFVHRLIRDPQGQASLIRLAQQTAPGLLVSASGYGDGAVHPQVAEAADFLLPHWNGTKVEQLPARLAALQAFGRPIVANEDDKTGADAVAALRACVGNGASYGLMLKECNQTFPFRFDGATDDPVFYAGLRALTTRRPAAEADAGGYVPPPESQGGWRRLEAADEVRRLAGMDPAKLDELRTWLLASDGRSFAAVVIRNGYVVLEVERGNSAKTDARRVASVSKAVCATVLAIACEQSRQGRTPRRMSFDDSAFEFIPWAQPLSDPRKARITVRQLLNHTSGLCPEALGAPNDGSWEYILGHSGDARTATLAFDPGTACGYSSHALAHAALVCETVTGKPYDQFAVEALFRPLGSEHWWFQYYEGGDGVGRHPSHGLGMPARDLARIGYCMLRGGRWGDAQVIPAWFVRETAAATHSVTTPEMRWGLNPQVFTHGWELPARHRGESGRSGAGIPADARSKPGSGGQLLAFVPSLDLVVARQTGSSGDWAYEECLRRACGAVLPAVAAAGPAAVGVPPPYPPSPAVAGVAFDFATHRRLALGSDNWPTTWAADGHLYTAWGDGGGFGGSNSLGRVSLGVARVEGAAADCTGHNVWGGVGAEHPATFEGKSYGLLGVGGVLYMWVSHQPNPHLDQCQLASSEDHGATWQFADWSFRYSDGLTVPTFLGFGRDYEGARDEYVYSYFIQPTWGPGKSPTGNYGFDIHRPGRVYLARVPREAVLDRSRYEWFAGRAADGGPRWSAALSDRQPVFEDANGVGWNLSVSYNPGLRRYLLATEHGATHAGRLGVFDAPEPWGPWTTVAYEERWGEGHVEVSAFYWSFPTKWLSADGTRFALVFTGKNSNDSWNTVEGRFVRRAGRPPQHDPQTTKDP